MMQTFTGKQYLKIDIANNFGKDKLDWNDRIAWFDENEGNLFNIVHKAKESPLFYAGINAWKKVQEGQACHYPISLDATSSGFQWLSLTTHDTQAAMLCNVIDTGHREDAYTRIYDIMDRGDLISRNALKNAVMTSLYSSEAEPKKVFGEGALYEHFQRVMELSAPKVWAMNKAFIALWDAKATEYSWVMPDLGHVHNKVYGKEERSIIWDNQPWTIETKVNKATPTGRSLGANSTHSIDALALNEMIRRCMFNPADVRNALDVCFTLPGSRPINERDNAMVEALWIQYRITGFLSVRIIQHLNSENIDYCDVDKILSLVGSLPKKPFQIMTVHDCFRCLPSYGNDLRKQYNIIMHDVAQATILENIILAISGKKMVFPKDPTFAAKVLESNYSLT